MVHYFAILFYCLLNLGAQSLTSVLLKVWENNEKEYGAYTIRMKVLILIKKIPIITQEYTFANITKSLPLIMQHDLW